MIDSEKMLHSIFRLEKWLSKKWRWKTASKEKDKVQLENDIKYVNKLRRTIWALYLVEDAYEGFKRDENNSPSEAEDTVFECISKLYSCLGDLLENKK